MMYEVFWVGGDRDGQTLGEFEEKIDAIRFAKAFEKEHEGEFDELCGGVSIVGPDGHCIEW